MIADLNDRVGKNEANGYVVGKDGEVHKNGNGIIEFAVTNKMKACNIFEHKDIQKYTRVMKSRNDKSIIDLILITFKYSKMKEDDRVMRGYDIGSNHNWIEV